jgi:signal transduction histidine kinase
VAVPYHAIGDSGQLQALLDGVIAVESETELPGVMRKIAETACTLTEARYGALSLVDPSGKGYGEFVYVGMDEETVGAIGQIPNGMGLLGLLVSDPKPLRLSDLTTHPASIGFPPAHPKMRTFLGVPLRIGDEVLGNLYVTEKSGGAEFTSTDEALVVTLAGAIGIAMDHARLRKHVGELNLAAERERIARDLHDTVIQRLFATGMSLQSAMPNMVEGDPRSRVEEAVQELDDTIRQIRTTIFALDPPIVAQRGVRSQVLDVCAENAQNLGFEPEVRFNGAIDRYVSKGVIPELLATLREALSNVVQHAGAHHVVVDLTVAVDVHMRIIDDGVGVKRDNYEPGRGLINMAKRAEELDGSFTMSDRPEGGSELIWRVPLGE